MAGGAAPCEDEDPAIVALIARSAIATNLARHSRGVDRNEAAVLASAYAPAASVAYGMFDGPAQAFAAMLTDAMAGGAVTSHRTSNMLIHPTGDTARSESYVVAYTRTAESGAGDRQRLIGGRYLDRHARVGDGWRIAHRTYVLDWNLNVADRETLPLGGTRGGHRSADPAHALFAGLSHHHPGDMPMSQLADALAKQALHDLVATCARATDRGDAALLASAFHPDADVVSGVVDAKAPDFARDVVAFVRANLRSCFHSITNEYFEISGDRAAGETYVFAHMATLGDDPQETLTGGRYLDRFERREGAWRIAQRTFVQDWSMTQPFSHEADGMYETLTTRGGWSPDDPSIAFFRD